VVMDLTVARSLQGKGRAQNEGFAPVRAPFNQDHFDLASSGYRETLR
jgi:hypothetical protein